MRPGDALPGAEGRPPRSRDTAEPGGAGRALLAPLRPRPRWGALGQPGPSRVTRDRRGGLADNWGWGGVAAWPCRGRLRRFREAVSHTFGFPRSKEREGG